MPYATHSGSCTCSVCYDEYMKSHFHADPEEDKKLTFRFEQSLKKGVTPHTITLFRKIIYDYYEKYGRAFAWRMTEDPYHILVSEIMLQQTLPNPLPVRASLTFSRATPGRCRESVPPGSCCRPPHSSPTEYRQFPDLQGKGSCRPSF